MKQSLPVKMDRMRNLRYGHAAIAKAEDIIGRRISDININRLSFGEAAKLIWAGLEHEDRELTPDRVLEIMDDHDLSMGEILGMAAEAIVMAFPPQKKKEVTKQRTSPQK